MRKNLLSIAFIFLFTISSFSQIEMGKIEKAVEKENKIAFPAYDNLENFINHSDYYRAKTTKILESAIAAPAYMGESNPAAAIGIPIAL